MDEIIREARAMYWQFRKEYPQESAAELKEKIAYWLGGEGSMHLEDYLSGESTRVVEPQ